MATRIVVPQRTVQGGLDAKFDEDPYGKKLHGLLTADDYTDSVTRINETIKPARSKKVDGVLLATGMFIIPLAAWGVRHKSQVKRRKKLLHKAILEFNASHPDLYMRWNRRPESRLTIERRNEELHGAAPIVPHSDEDAEFEVPTMPEAESYA